MRNDELNEKMVDKEQTDNLDFIKQDDHKDDGDKGDDHAGMKEPEVPAAPEVPGALPEVADIVLALDLSGSFGEAGLATVQNPNFLAGLDADLAAGGATDVVYGITSFIDYPFLPFGEAGDFPYNTDQGVTEDVAAAQPTLAGLMPGSGGPLPEGEPEAQLVALQQVGLRAEGEVGYRPDAERFVVLTTDAPFHQAGAYPQGGPNDNDTDLADGTGQGGVEDYPSVEQVAEALVAGNVTPIFAVTQEEFDANTYQNLITQLNAEDDSIGGTVVPLLPDSSNLADVILAGLTEATAPDMLMV